MKKRIFLASVIGSLVFGSAALFAQDSQTGNGKNGNGNGADEPPAAGIHWAKGEGGKQANPFGAGPVKLLNWYGGPVQRNATTVTPIFWGPSWGTNPGDKISGLNVFYTGVSGSHYIGTNTEYSDGTGSVTNLVSLNASIIDTSAAAGGNSTSTILNEVCKAVTNSGTPLVPNGYYPVYVDLPRGSAGYCAWHSAGSCGSTPIQFGFFFKLDGDAGCTPGGSTGSIAGDPTKPNSQGLANLANVSGHELSEMLTDPRLNAWYDRSGNENADKCAWTFGSTLLTFPGGSTWKIQGNWSNNAYNNNKGYTSGTTFERGCIDGTN